MVVVVFALGLRLPPWIPEQPAAGDYGRLSLRLIAVTTGICVAVLGLISNLIVHSHFRYKDDAFYFINRLSMHADFGRRLYDQIEFPYGPLLFYLPLGVKVFFSPFHVSLVAAYFIAVVLAHAIGLVFVAWVINRLPMLHRWRVLLFLLCAVHTLQLDLGINYTYLRFFTAAACIVLASRFRSPIEFAAVLFFSQMACLGLSPEMGFAFFAAGTAYAAWYLVKQGRRWIPAVVAPLAATGAFLLLVGEGYVRMVLLFSKGILNFIVEPLPHVLLFLFAFVWLIPPVLALFFRQQRSEAPMFAALYVLSLGLLPVAFGRADPGHLFLNEIVIYLLSMVAIGYDRPHRQRIWAVCVTLVLLWSAFLNIRVFRMELQITTRHEIFRRDAGVLGRTVASGFRKFVPSVHKKQLEYEQTFDVPIDMVRLQQIIGTDPIATPDLIPLAVEDQLRQSGQFTPSFYCFRTAILDQTAEQRQIKELNESRWMLGLTRAGLTDIETPSNSGYVLGFTLPYRDKRPPYVIGLLFRDNLKTNWQPAGEIGAYTVYRRR